MIIFFLILSYLYGTYREISKEELKPSQRTNTIKEE
jgi:hypothetical protein